MITITPTAKQKFLEIAAAAGVRIVIEEEQLPIRGSVLSACELLGLDPLYVANEGKLVVLLPAEQASAAVDLLRSHPLGANAACIGRVVDGRPGCEVETGLGARRALRMASGELLPRIC